VRCGRADGRLTHPVGPP